MGDTTQAIGTVSKGDLVERARLIVEEYYPDKMTLRQVYYQLVARMVIENKVSSYKRLSAVLVEAREDGIIPWDAMEDRTRSISGSPSLDHMDDPIAEVDRIISYLENTEGVDADKWRHQEWYVEVWLEKQALEGVFESAIGLREVVLMPGRGYSSATFLKDAAERLELAKEHGRKVAILYFGDYDPSGMDIERYVSEKMAMLHGIEIDHFSRIALTLDQIERYKLPPVPAKTTDSRRDAFVEVHGDMAVELDALDIRILKDMVQEAIAAFWDSDCAMTRREDLQKARWLFRAKLVDSIRALAERWEDEMDEDDEDDGVD